MRTVVISANTSWYIYNFRKNTILKILSLGFRVVVVAPYDKYTNNLKEIGVEYYPIKISRNGVNPFVDIVLFLKFLFLFKKIKPCAVFNFTSKNNIYGGVAAKLCGAKVFNNISGMGVVFSKNNFLSFLLIRLYKISQKFADGIFFQNDSDMDVFHRNHIVPFEKSVRVPGSGVDLSRFNMSIEHSFQESIKFILVGRMLVEKGVLLYVDAARELIKRYGKKVQFQLLGFVDSQNPSSVTLKQISEWEYEGIVHYLGESDKVEEHLKDVHCVVLPSFYSEGVPKSLLEAAAMGKPIITTDNVGCRDVVDDGVNGFLCQPKNLESLVSKLDSFIKLDDKSKLLMGTNSRAKVELEFDECIVIDKYILCLESCG